MHDAGCGGAFRWLQALLYAVVLVVVALRNAWTARVQSTREALWRLAARHSWCRPLVRIALWDVGKAHLGLSPARPTSLGVVLAQQLQDGVGPIGNRSDNKKSDLRQLALLIAW